MAIENIKFLSKLFLLCLTISIDLTTANRPPNFIQNLDLSVTNENVPLGTLLGTLQAYDPENSSLTYGLDGTDLFSVDPRTGQVTVRRPIDREAIGGSVKFNVFVEDVVSIGGVDNNRVRVPITVFIIDENDNPPKFDAESTNIRQVNISEDASLGTVVVNKLTARDVDLVGSILRVKCDNCSPYFSVNLIQESTTSSISFSVSLIKSIDYQSNVQSIPLELVVSDGSYDTPHRIQVNIINIQNKPPIFVGSNTAVISEDYPIGSLVMTIKAIDGDSMTSESYRHLESAANNNRIHNHRGRPVVYELVSNPQDCFKLDLRSGELRVANKLDKEAFPSTNGVVTLIVKAYEVDNIERPYFNSNDALSSSLTSVTITLQDVNDESPKFNKHEYYVTIPEGVPNGTPLASLDMLVEDRDTGSNSVFNIALEDASGIFSVEPPLATGSSSVSIKVAKGPLDYENPNQRKFILLVTAKEAFTKEQRSSTATVYVTVEDVNDNLPTFDEEMYAGSVLEDALSGTIIKTIRASDRDSLEVTSLTYSLLGNGADLFKVHATTGVITVAECETPGQGNCIDYETRNSYYLSYQANDGFGHSSVVPLTINIMDSNDNPPIFSREKYFAVIDEGATKFEPPLKVKARDADVTSIITYSILTGNQEKLFSIEPHSGEIKVNQEVRSKKDKIILKVQASDGGKGITAVDVEITIRDANDNSPIFEKDEYIASVSESAKPRTIVEKVTASDADSGQNAEITYKIEKGAFDAFVIDQNTGIVSVADMASLDYDRKSVYFIQIIATDKGVTPRTGTTSMIIKLVNDNDKSPYFYPTTQRCQVNEITMVGSRVHKLNATDPDADSPNSLIYRIENVNAVDKNGQKIPPSDKVMYEVDKYFKIDSEGFIVVASRLNRDLAAVVVLNVSVTDISSSAPSTQIGYGSVIITLIDHNDHPPVFSLPWTRQRPEYIFSMVEEQPVGTVIANILATDVESKISRYAIEPESEYFDINSESGVLTVRKVIDFESLPNYSDYLDNINSLSIPIRFNVFAYDSGIPQLNVQALVTVNIINLNDNEPIFEQPFYNTTIPEDAQPEAEVIRVIAKDADRGKYGLVRYSIISQSHAGNSQIDAHNSGFFIIDELTGSIKVAPGAILDRERGNKEVTLQVAASDNPNASSKNLDGSNQDLGHHQARIHSVPVYITVSDVNDNQPVFTQSEYTGNVLGHFDGSSTTRVPVLQVSAKDPDEGLNGKIVYKIIDGNTKNIFNIDQYTGVIYAIKSPLDVNPETKDYKIKVEARDMDGKSNFFDHSTVTIKVVEMNRNKPKFLKPSEANVYFLENQKVGSKVIKVEAYDEDNGINGIIKYSFKKEVNQNVQETDEFRIDPDSGLITSKVSFDREERDRYELVLSAEDFMGEPESYESLQKLTIIIKDMDDNKPEFSRSENNDESYVFNFPENQPRGTLIGKVTAIDRDEIEKKVFYTIIDGNANNDFHLDKSSGKLFCNSSFDREEKIDYFLVIRASSSQTLTVQNGLQDQTDHWLTKQEITRRSYDPSDLSLALVHVIITDVNDNKPVFTKPIYRAGIHHKSEIGRAVPVTIKANDPDNGANSTLTYTISSIDLYRKGYDAPDTPVRPIPSPFSIDPVTGRLTTTHLMAQYPVGSRFIIYIEAREKASPHRTASSKVYLWVYDENQLIRVTIKSKPEIVNSNKDKIEEILCNTTNQRAIINDIKYHFNLKTSKTVKTWSDVYVLVVDDRTFTDLSPKRVIAKLDSRAGYLQQENQLEIDEITLSNAVPNVAAFLSTDIEEMDIVSLILLILIVLMIVGFLAMIAGCCCLKSWYHHKLISKASKAAFKSRKSIISGREGREAPRSVLSSSIHTTGNESRLEPKSTRSKKAESHLSADRRQQVPRNANNPSTSAKENPLWSEGVAKFYEEQELSFRVSPNGYVYNTGLSQSAIPTSSLLPEMDTSHYASLAATLRTRVRQRQPNYHPHDNHEYHELRDDKSSPETGDRTGLVQ